MGNVFCAARFRVFLISSCLSLIVLPCFSLASSAAPIDGPARVLIMQPIDEGNLVELKGNTRPEMTTERDLGPVGNDFPMEHMLLQLQRSPDLEKALQEFIGELHDPNSPNFHKWLTAQQFGQTFGMAKQDIDTITIWLRSHGFSVNTVYPGGMLIDFSGSAAQVLEAFHTEIHYLNANGAIHIANASDYQIPAALAQAVVGIVSLHDFVPRTMYQMHGQYTFKEDGDTYEAVTPADLATIYNLTPLFTAGYSGKGQTIAVIEDSNVYNTADWTTFRSTFGLSSYTSGSFTQVHPVPPSGNNNCSNPEVNSNDIEAILDAEYASAAAPGSAIELASCADTTTTFGGLIAFQNLINGSTPPAIISISYGECEAYNGAVANAAYKSAYEQAVAEGVSVFVAAGDEGAASCDAGAGSAMHGIGVSGFASTPYNVAVGGTDFGDTYAKTNSTYWSSTNNSYNGSALSYIPEIPWNNSCASALIASYLGYDVTYGSTGFCNSSLGEEHFLTTVAGSGGPSGCATGAPSVSGVVSGTCAGYAKPSWQSVLGNPDDGVRDIPDISLFAANGIWGHYYIFCDSDELRGGAACTGAPSSWSGAGGTSFASPIMAGIQALVNQKVGGPQGNPNLVYYSLAAGEYGTSGNSSCNSTLGNGISSSCIFHDVTLGDMDINCKGSSIPTDTFDCYMPSGINGVLSTSNSAYSIAYGTATASQSGWNFGTGIGTVNAYNLVVAWPTTATCSIAITPATNAPFQQTGGSSTIAVTAGSGCTWSVTNNLSWVSITSGSSGSGNGTVAFTIAANPDAATRSGNITIAGQSYTITQYGLPCTYSISPTTSGSLGAAATTATITVTALAGCAWTTEDSLSWATVTSGSGAGNGTVEYSVTANVSSAARTGTMTVAGQAYTVNQAGSCTGTITPASDTTLAYTTGNFSVAVTAPAGCTWLTSDTLSWATIISGASGSGNGKVSFNVAANPDTTARTGTVTIAGQAFTITQAAAPCTFSLSAVGSTALSADGATGSVSVAAPVGCTWQAVDTLNWASITSGGTGSGNGTVNYSVTANPAYMPRAGNISVAGKFYTVNQAAQPCTYSISSVASTSLGYAGAAGIIVVTAPASCSWIVANGLPWVTITSASTGTGNGTVTYSAAATNTSMPRTGTMTVAGQTYTINQTGAPCTYVTSPAQSALLSGNGATSTFAVSTPAGCAWTLSGIPSFVELISSDSGSGSQTVSYSVSANTTDTARTGSITVSGSVANATPTIFSVTQAGNPATCTYTIAPSPVPTVDSAGGTVTLTVATQANCPLSISGTNSWLGLTSSPTAATGQDSVVFTVEPNTSTAARMVNLIIVNTTVVIQQNGTATTQ